MDESFDIGDAEQMQIEEIAQVANLDAITMCSCRGMCLRKEGKNACPCKTIGQYSWVSRDVTYLSGGQL